MLLQTVQQVDLKAFKITVLAVVVSNLIFQCVFYFYPKWWWEKHLSSRFNPISMFIWIVNVMFTNQISLVYNMSIQCCPPSTSFRLPKPRGTFILYLLFKQKIKLWLTSWWAKIMAATDTFNGKLMGLMIQLEPGAYVEYSAQLIAVTISQIVSNN